MCACFTNIIQTYHVYTPYLTAVKKKVEIELERKKIIDISRPPYSYLLLPHIHIISRYFFS